MSQISNDDYPMNYKHRIVSDGQNIERVDYTIGGPFEREENQEDQREDLSQYNYSNQGKAAEEGQSGEGLEEGRDTLEGDDTIRKGG
jgi:hypothetical protein